MGGQMNGGRGAAARPVLVHDRGREGVDSLSYAAGVNTYVIHVGAGLAAGERATGEREITVPGALVERVAWLAAIALEHRDTLEELAPGPLEAA